MEILIAVVVVGIFVYGVYDFIKGYIKNKSDTKDFDVLIKSANNLGFKNKFIDQIYLQLVKLFCDVLVLVLHQENEVNIIQLLSLLNNIFDEHLPT